VAGIHFLPLTGSGWKGGLTIEGRPEDGKTPPVVSWRVITPGYFDTLRLHLAAGRLFTADNPADRAGAPPTAVINETMARQLWPGESPLGKRIRQKVEGSKEWVTVVGVVGDSRFESLGAKPAPVMYRPYSQVGRNFTMSLLLRCRSDPMGLAAAVSREIWAVDKGVPVFKIRSMEQVIYESAARPRVIMALLAAFAAVALLLGTLGVYSVMSYAVRNKVREIGIRMALGARRGQILRWMLRRSLLLALLGVAIGLTVALWTARLMSSLLFEVSARDPLTFVLVPLGLLASALAGSAVPSLRASRISPTAALKNE
jgi:putative ABC transport system permease protein